MRVRIMAAALGAGLVGVVPLARANDMTVAGTPDSTVGPLISGTASYVDGTYAWTDYAYDDRGVNASGSPNNAADLIQLQLSLAEDGDLRIRAILETLLDADVPVVRVGFDVDDDVTTGTARLPGWQADAPLGLDAVVTLSSGDEDTNAMAGVLPAGLFGGGLVRAVATVGIAGSDTVYDLAFLHAEDVCTMPSEVPATCVPNPDNQPGQHLRQADVLAGRAAATNAVGTIDIAKLRAGATEAARVDERGFYSLLYHSDLNLGEGIRLSGTATRSTALPHTLFAGPYQPYVVRLPGRFTAPMPAIVNLHGRSGNHMQPFVNSFQNYDPAAIVVGVLGRGYDVGFGGVDWLGFIEPEGAYGEQDVLDVLADLRARGLVDPEHVVLAGISMGGVGAFHFAEMHPDVFTGVLPIVGGNGGILPANWGTGLIENLSNMRLRMANGAIDPLAHMGSQSTPAMLHALGTVDFRAWVALRRHHEWQAGLVACVFSELLSRPRVVDPARVVYSVNAAFEVEIPETGLRRSHTGAYWVSGLTLRPDDLDRSVLSQSTARIDVTSLAKAVRTVVGTPVAGVGENLTAGADYCGSSSALRSSDAWEMNGLSLAPGPTQPTSNGMTVSLRGLTAATFDLPRMGISVDQPVLVGVTGDGPGEITMRGPWPDGAQVAVARDGEQIGSVDVIDGAVTLAGDFLGAHDYDLTIAE